MQRLSVRDALLLSVLAVFVLVGLTWTNYRFALASPGGNDFLPRWLGTRLFLSEGQSPYSDESSLAIQEFIYGRAAEEGDDQALFAYPFYSILLFLPFAAIKDYAVARALWMTTLEVSLLLTALGALALSRWRPKRSMLAVLLLFSIAWYHGARPLINGNAAILVALLITSGLWFLRAKQDVIAGFLFALSTIKPQIVALLIPFVLIWAVSQKRTRLLTSFALSMILLLGLSFWVQPDWLMNNIAQVLTYSSYTPPGTPTAIFTDWWGTNGQIAGWALSVVIFILLLFEWWAALGKDFDWLLWTALLTLAATQLVGIPTTTANYAALLPILPMVLSFWNRHLGDEKEWAVWLLIALLFAGLWLLFVLTLQPGYQFREHNVMLLPAPIFLLLNLYWLRWWALHPAKVSYPAQRAQKKT